MFRPFMGLVTTVVAVIPANVKFVREKIAIGNGRSMGAI